jgi:hypothetical protein
MGDDDSFAVYMRVQDGMAPLPHMDPKYNAARRAGHQWFDDNGWDAAGRIEIPVSWGQQDIFKWVGTKLQAGLSLDCVGQRADTQTYQQRPLCPHGRVEPDALAVDPRAGPWN